MVLREVWGRIGGCLSSLGETTFLPTGRIPVNEAFSGRTVEQPHGLELHLNRCPGCLRLLECRSERRTLRSVAHRRGARLSHILFRGSDIRHEIPGAKLKRAPYARAEPGI
jgi:hypothetical protein